MFSSSTSTLSLSAFHVSNSCALCSDGGEEVLNKLGCRCIQECLQLCFG